MRLKCRSSKNSLFLLCVGIISVGQISLAQPSLIVSDVDDTVRSMNSKSLSEMSSRLSDVTNAFSGISVLYENWKLEGAERLVGFVTAGSTLFSNKYKAFMTANHFPNDFLVMKGLGSGGTYEYKVKAVRKILADRNPEKVLFIGDNSSEDTNVYQTIVAENSQLVSQTYIHQIFSGSNAAPVHPGQTPFLTPADLAIHLFNTGEISEATLRQTLLTVANDLRPGGKAVNVVDHFFECGDFFLGRGWPQLTAGDSDLNDLSEEILAAVEQRCANPSSRQRRPF